MCKINIECFNNENKLIFKLVFIIKGTNYWKCFTIGISYIVIFKSNKLNKDLMK